MSEEAVAGKPLPHADPRAEEGYQWLHPIVGRASQIPFGAEANIEEELGSKLGTQKGKLHAVVLGQGETEGEGVGKARRHY